MVEKTSEFSPQSHAGRMMRDAFLLTGAGLLLKTAGVGFGVFLARAAGAEAMGLYALLAGVYGFAVTLGTSGIHLSVTRAISKSLGLGKRERVLPCMQRALLISLVLGCVSALLLGGFAGFVGTHWLKDARTVPSLCRLAVTLPLISVTAAMGGYFSAVRRVWKSALASVVEQLVRIVATVFFLSPILPGDAEGACLALVTGGNLGVMLSFLTEACLYLADRRRFRTDANPSLARAEGRELIRTGAPIAVSAYLRSGLITLEHILIPEGLRNSGSSHAEALKAVGTVQSMALPILLYPASLIGAFAGLLVPEVTEASVQSGEKRIPYMISRVLSLTLLYAIGVGAVISCFAPALGQLLYPNTETARFLRILAPLVPIMYADTSTDALLKGLGEQVASMKINVADAALSVVLVLILVPLYGIRGYLITVYVSEFFNTVLSVTKLLSLRRVKISLLRWIVFPTLAAILATQAAAGIGTVLQLPTEPLPLLLLMLAASVCYVLCLNLFGSISKEDRAWIRAVLTKRE